MQKRKLQVFVSSTYKHMKHERQAAVEAILSAGHIPAGMELFAAGDKSQWAVIQEWIEESDVYMLILGERYGSIEPESGKSYTHLEYELALRLSKPLFAVVVTEEKLKEKVKEENDLDVIESENQEAFQEFKDLVLSKTVRFWDDVKDIKLYIHETLNQFSRRENLIGWIPGDQGVGAEMVEEITRLSKENATLRAKIAQYEVSSSNMINGMTIEEVLQMLEDEKVSNDELDSMNSNNLQSIKNVADNEEMNLLHVLKALARLIDGSTPVYPSIVIKKLCTFGLIRLNLGSSSFPNLPEFTDDGRKIFMYLNKRGLIQQRPKLSHPIFYNNLTV